MALVIGLTGRMGSGKGTAAEHLKKTYKARQFIYSDILADVFRRLHIEVTRANLQALGKCLREGMGTEVLVDAMKGDLENAKDNVLLVDGLRYVNEAEMLRGFKDNLLIFIDAPEELRYDRLRKRAQKGEGAMTFKEFQEREAADTEKELAELKKMADCVVENTGSVKELCDAIDAAMKNR